MTCDKQPIWDHMYTVYYKMNLWFRNCESNLSEESQDSQFWTIHFTWWTITPRHSENNMYAVGKLGWCDGLWTVQCVKGKWSCGNISLQASLFHHLSSTFKNRGKNNQNNWKRNKLLLHFKPIKIVLSLIFLGKINISERVLKHTVLCIPTRHSVSVLSRRTSSKAKLFVKRN